MRVFLYIILHTVTNSLDFPGSVCIEYGRVTLIISTNTDNGDYYRYKELHVPTKKIVYQVLEVDKKKFLYLPI